MYFRSEKINIINCDRLTNSPQRCAALSVFFHFSFCVGSHSSAFYKQLRFLSSFLFVALFFSNCVNGNCRFSGVFFFLLVEWLPKINSEQRRNTSSTDTIRILANRRSHSLVLADACIGCGAHTPIDHIEMAE